MRPLRYVAAILLSALFVAVGCQVGDPTPTPPPLPNQPPPAAGAAGANVGVVNYHAKDKVLRHEGPFVRCTRPGDYLEVDFSGSARRESYLIGIRVLLDERTNPNAPTSTFTARVGDRVLSLHTQKLDPATTGLWAVYWVVKPSVDKVRIDQSSSVRFECAIQKKDRGGGFHWNKQPEPWRNGGNPSDSSKPCFP